MMFEFEDVANLEKVLLYEPWTNNKYLVAFWRLEGIVEPENLVFNQTSFWVQIHDLSILSLKKEVAMALERLIGRVMKTRETDEELGGGHIMRIRVQVDITKPLTRGHKIGLAKGGEGWVSFKFERLPNFCYWCGLLTHSKKDCSFWLKNQETLRREDPGMVCD